MVRWNSNRKPSLGGLTFFIVFMAVYALGSALPVKDLVVENMTLFGLFLATSLGFLIGLVDDAYNTKPLLKFLGQVLCANILVFAGFVIELTPNVLINQLFTILWVVAIMNSINMLDNMDGVTASVSIGVLLSCISIALLESDGFNILVLIAIGTTAGILGFLRYNWFPSRMFMGDTGSQFLGVFLSALSIKYLWSFSEGNGNEWFQIRQFLFPLLAFIMPIIDTTTVFYKRIARGQSPFVGGRDHTTHHLVYLGLKDSSVAWVFTAISLTSLTLIIFVYLTFDQMPLFWNYCIPLYFVTLFLVFQWLYIKGKQRRERMESIEHNA